MGASEIRLPLSGQEIKGKPARKERKAPCQIKVEFSRVPVNLDRSRLKTWRTLWIAPVAAGYKKRPLMACAVKGGAFQWVQVPPGETLQPEATGAVMEVTKWPKPSA